MENLKNIVEISQTYKEVMEYLGWNINGSNYSKIKQIIIDEKISTDHFLNMSDFMKIYNTKRILLPIENILVENSEYQNRGSLKKRLVKENLLDYKCFKCGNEGEWMGEKISLILDHKNGVNNDNRLENLRFACPNCNSTLDTHCGGNVKNKKNIKQPKELPKDFHIKKNENLRKVERPSYENLKNEIKQIGYSATGRKYGVSDNSIRKWLKTYEKLNNGSIV
jgi:hypothetical protein